jgi:hypothetical protein
MYREELIGSIADFDEELANTYLEGEKLLQIFLKKPFVTLLYMKNLYRFFVELLLRIKGFNPFWTQLLNIFRVQRILGKLKVLMLKTVKKSLQECQITMNLLVVLPLRLQLILL